ncbi:MAG: Cache domain family protein [Candidatus Dadabacteria bacterium]
MKPMFVTLVLVLMVVPLLLWAADQGTPAEAKAMLQKAVAHYNSVGRKQALTDFTAAKTPFRDRDLYVVCIGPDHLISANGAFPQYVGLTSDILKDASGKLLGRAIIDAVATKSEGSVFYMMINPMTGKIEPKVLFVKKLGEDVCGVGAYNPH